MVVNPYLVRFDRDVRAVMGPLSVLKNCTKRGICEGVPSGHTRSVLGIYSVQGVLLEML